MRTRLYIASCEALGDETRFERLARTVPSARREKLKALKQSGARRLSLGVSLLLVRALSDEGLHAGEIAVNEYGKPWLPALPDVHFSLSHSADTALCAVSSESVGCDVELPRRFDPKIARRFFHPAERDWLFSRPAAEQPDAFLQIWTRKESFMKALGLGFSLPMESFAVVPRLIQDADGRPWQLRTLRDGERCIALCGLAGVADAPLIRVDFGEVEA